MAAGPELLDALKIVLIQLGPYRDGDGAAKYHCVNIANAAVAKAGNSLATIPLVSTIREQASAALEAERDRLRAVNAELLAALEIVANSGKFSCFDDTAWDQINNAIAKSNS